MMCAVCLLAYVHGLSHSSSHVILWDSGCGALWEGLHSDFQGSLKNSVKMALTLSAVIGFWIQAPAVGRDCSTSSLFSSVSVMGIILESFFISLFAGYS